MIYDAMAATAGQNLGDVEPHTDSDTSEYTLLKTSQTWEANQVIERKYQLQHLVVKPPTD